MRMRTRMSAVGLFRATLGGLGLAALGYGVAGLLTEPQIRSHVARASVARWLIGGLLVHDVIVAPVVFALCAVAYRFTSARWRGRLAVLLLVGGSLVLISVPALLRHGRNPNTTVLPLGYARNLGVLLGALFAAVALYSAVDAARRRRGNLRHAVVLAETEVEEAEPDDEDEVSAAECSGGDAEPDAVPDAESDPASDAEPDPTPEPAPDPESDDADAPDAPDAHADGHSARED